MISRLIFLLAGLGGCFWMISHVTHENYLVFISISELLLVIVGPICFVCFAFSPADIGRAIGDVVAGKRGTAVGTRSADSIRALGRSTWWMGWVGALIGYIFMLQSLDDPKRIGAGLGAALISVLYAVFMNGAFYKPCEDALRSQGDSKPPE